MNRLKILILIYFTTTIMTKADNPFFEKFDTEHGSVPFDRIKFEHYELAIERGIELANKEIEDICNNTSTPDFNNVIVALESAGADLDRVLNVFYPLLSSNTSDEMMELSDRMAPKLSAYSTGITLNKRLWEKIKYVWEHTDKDQLNAEDRMLLTQTYDSFANSGAKLEGADRETFKSLKQDLSQLTTRFSQNVLKELNGYEIWLTKEDLSGLPETLISGASTAAAEKGRLGEYLFTLHQPVYMAFMKYSNRRDLREKFYRLYTGRNLTGEFSNAEILKQIANKRMQLAQLLGYETYADYALRNTMAETPARVMDLLDSLKDAYIPAQQSEFAELKNFAKMNAGFDDELMPWDYSYFANMLKQSKYDYDEEALRPYFELNNTIEGVFGLATKLYGLTFRDNKNVAVYHEDVKSFDVLDKDGAYLGMIYTDFFPRSSKSPGAWMTDFKGQWKEADGTNSRPHVSIVMNFTKPTAEKPSCLTPYEVETFLHEFGHALHGLLANTTYKSLSGTNVYRDFVELPSQFNENFMTQREYLDGFARHYQTGESIPPELVEQIICSSQFGAGYACVRQLNFGYLDMAWHTLKTPYEGAVADFETEASRNVSMFPEVENSLISPQFGHIFSGGYAAGYYSYKWAEVLDADAFDLFREKGIFNKEAADLFRENVLSKGGTENPTDLYRKFRGRDATIDALLRRDGIKKVKTPVKGNLSTLND